MRYRDARADHAGPAAIVLRGVLSVPEFRAVLQRERNRSERSHLPFSVLICAIRGGIADGHGSNGNGRARSAADRGRDPGATAEAVAVVLRQRLRSTDEVGWIDRDRLAALLPYTPIEEAHAVLATLERELTRAGVSVPWTIESYPPAGFGRVPSTNGSPRSRPEHDDSRDPPTSGPGVGVSDPIAPRRVEASAPPGVSAPRVPDDVVAEVPLLPSILFAQLPAWKRAMDVAGATIALMILWPVILAAAIAIKLDSRGPVFYRQRRVGAGGRIFGFFKLRTMQVGADEMKCDLRGENEASGPVFKMRSDPRITRVGRFLRRSSIDELPQFWNVLRGDMSLVGPRPPTPDEVVHYEPWQLRRLQITPGITCLWQVSGRSEVAFVDWVRLDLRYAERRSPAYDLSLIARTLPAVISGRGAF
jgi:lipopolysaccharide/colanic/teichoic acid biosynthesis glycosyltransferase